VPYLLPMDGMAAAAREVHLAEQAWRVSLLRTGEGAEEAVAAARQTLDQAQKALDACYERIDMTALAKPDFEVLVGKHPPREGTTDEKYNAETFPLACFLACAPADMPEKEWIEFLKRNVSTVEYDELLLLAVEVNVRRVNPGIPKG
jgi:hypothetical protein